MRRGPTYHTISLANPPRLFTDPPSRIALLQAERLAADKATELYRQEAAKRKGRPDPLMEQARELLAREEQRAKDARLGGRPKGKTDSVPRKRKSA